MYLLLMSRNKQDFSIGRNLGMYEASLELRKGSRTSPIDSKKNQSRAKRERNWKKDQD